MANITKHFSLAEMCKSITALKLRLDNTPNQEVITNLTTLCEKVLEPIRKFYGKPILVNSGYRSPEVNKAVGGSKFSDHCKGFAADIEINGVSNVELANWIVDNLNFTQVILEFYTIGQPNSGWVHVSYDPERLKNESLTATRQSGKTVYLKGLVA